MVSCVYTAVHKPQLQPSVTNHCLYIVKTALNFAVGSFYCKTTLIWLSSSLSVGTVSMNRIYMMVNVKTKMSVFVEIKLLEKFNAM